MSDPIPLSHPKQRLVSTDVEGFDALTELALQVWRHLDPVLWELTHNPWIVLQTASPDKLVCAG